jgi:hypothetical protein
MVSRDIELLLGVIRHQPRDAVVAAFNLAYERWSTLLGSQHPEASKLLVRAKDMVASAARMRYESSWFNDAITKHLLKAVHTLRGQKRAFKMLLSDIKDAKKHPSLLSFSSDSLSRDAPSSTPQPQSRVARIREDPVRNLIRFLKPKIDTDPSKPVGCYACAYTNHVRAPTDHHTLKACPHLEAAISTARSAGFK